MWRWRCYWRGSRRGADEEGLRCRGAWSRMIMHERRAKRLCRRTTGGCSGLPSVLIVVKRRFRRVSATGLQEAQGDLHGGRAAHLRRGRLVVAIGILDGRATGALGLVVAIRRARLAGALGRLNFLQRGRLARIEA